MKARSIGLASVLAALCWLFGLPASAHWNPGDPYKWVQNPDLAQTGMDVRATATAILADDFRCAAAGPLTDIHVWGSWYHDVLPDDNPGKVTFILAIHKDIPAGTGGIPYGRPGAVLWYRSYPPGSFTWNLYQSGLQEGWLNPPSDYDSFADTKCYQYNFTVPAGAIRQTGTEAEPKVYWLAVQAVPEVPPAIFGWKTSPAPTQWNDASVWAQGNAPYSGTWNALEYPAGHPYDGSKLDLAFVVNGQPDKDWGDAPDSLANPRYPTLDDHDGARHVILEGLHMGTTVDYEIDGQPDTTATGDDSAGSDDEDGVRIPVLARGATVTIEIDVELDPYSKRAYVDAWLDCNQDDDWSDAGEQVLTSEPVEEGENEITVTIPTSTQTGTTFMRFRLSLAGGLAPTGEAPDGEVEDYEVIVAEPYDYGDAPEGAQAYLDGTIGQFPTCTGGTAGFIRHAESDAWFGPMVDFEGDGNAGACALFDWGDYDQDECAEDGDAGLITPTAYRLTGPGASNPCVGMDHTMLGCSCEIAQWGSSIDINVHNWLADTAYVNMLIDWDEDGTWSGASDCPEESTPEHVLVDFPIPKDHDGPLSALSPPDFRIGENPGLLWTRISITECPVGTSDWDGSGVFEAGETEDYLLHVATCDYGDAPDPYPTLKADNGPRHVISGTVRLGDLRDPELDGQPDPDALGDDHNDAIDDEDGVDFVTPFVPGEVARIDVTANFTYDSACLSSWIDWNADGDWDDSGEYFMADLAIPPGTVGYVFHIPHEAVPGETFARFRLNWECIGLSYDGPGTGGEVEDYKITILPFEDAVQNDLGDAPDSLNRLGIPMTAYPAGGPAGVAANFPTDALTPAPHTGPRHLSARVPAILGTWPGVSLETNADCGPDEDPTNNIIPGADSPNNDLFDDGVIGYIDGEDIRPMALENCQPTAFDYTVTLTTEASPFTNWYVNAWFDWNRDGDWDDTLECPGEIPVPEWAVQNQLLAGLVPGVHVFRTPQFVPWHPAAGPTQPIWMRITLADEVWPGGAGGCGPEDYYQYGETEDYYFTPNPPETDLDYGDAPDPTYPTLFLSNGAKHAVVSGIRLGAAIDAEPDGQPALDALGDDNNGSPDDEDGISFPTPLVPGTVAWVQVVPSVSGILDAWVDFNADGDWQDAGERIFDGLAVPAGSSVQSFPVPADAAGVTTYARFRFSTGGVVSYDGYASDGEVEDYQVRIERLKWAQPPDLSDEGMDVNASITNSPPYILADDFECTATAPITDIHIWGSWLNDILPKNEFGDSDPRQVEFTLSVHENIRPGVGGIDYSRPGALLKQWHFAPGEFGVWLYAQNLYEGWFNPPEEYTPSGDSICWQYDFPIPVEQWFLQEGTPDDPEVYWLDVQAKPLRNPVARFGWKSSTVHWNDNAVWGNGAEPFNGPWYELVYPATHPKKGMPMDLAFTINGTSQDFGDAPDPYPTLMTHNGASHGLVGSWYIGVGVDADPDGQPDDWAEGDDDDGTDDEDGVRFPTRLVPLCQAHVEVSASQDGKLDAWIDFNGDGDWDDTGEQIAASTALVAGENTITFDIPDVPGDCIAFARFRFSQNGGLSYTGAAPNGEVEDYRHGIRPRPAVVSIGEAKKLPLGTYVLLQDKIVTANWLGTLVHGYDVCIQDTDCSAGIWAHCLAGSSLADADVGDVMCCYGNTSFLWCQMRLGADHSWLVSTSAVEPVGQTNLASGGGPVYQTPPPPDVVNQVAVLDIANGLPGGPVEASGLNSMALLVQLWGKCTHIHTDAFGNPARFWLDDGSGIQTIGFDGNPVTGVEVRVPDPDEITIEIGGHYAVTGVMGTELREGSGCLRFLQTRTNDDIVQVTP